MWGGGGGGGRFSGRLGIHYYSLALKYTNIIFLIVGMVVTDLVFFLQEYRRSRICITVSFQKRKLTLILERRFFSLKGPKLVRWALTSAGQCLRHWGSRSLAHMQYFSLFTVSKSALYAQDSMPKCLARITCASARSAKWISSYSCFVTLAYWFEPSPLKWPVKTTQQEQSHTFFSILLIDCFI